MPHLNISRVQNDRFKFEMIEIDNQEVENMEMTIPKHGLSTLLKIITEILKEYDEIDVGEGYTLYENGNSPNF